MTRGLAVAAVAGLTALLLPAAQTAAATGVSAGAAWPRGTAVVSYASESALRAALAREPAAVLRRIPALRIAVLRPPDSPDRFAQRLARLPGITSVEREVGRTPYVEPALASSALPGGAYEWQYAAVKANLVPEPVQRAAAALTIAVVDTGADLSAPDLAAKTPTTWNVRTSSGDVVDGNGHGTFVASLAAGSATNGEGMAGTGGDARLLVVQAGAADGSFTDVQEAAAIVWAVDNGAKIVNLSLGGRDTSVAERRAIDYAVGKGVLLVAAVGNEGGGGNPVEYPAALLQPPGSNGVGGRGLAVAASTLAGRRASFSNSGSHVSLAAPGENVFGAVSAASPAGRYPRVPLPGSSAGLYGFASGTSFAAPQVAGAAALVWAANPSLSAEQVASILEQTASGRGAWTRELGFGVLDVAAAVARAQAQAAPAPTLVQLSGTREGRRVTLSWVGAGASSFRLAVTENGSHRVLLPSTTTTSASYSLASGNTYAFTVAALDAAGGETGSSQPWTVSLVQAPRSRDGHGVQPVPPGAAVDRRPRDTPLGGSLGHGRGAVARARVVQRRRLGARVARDDGPARRRALALHTRRRQLPRARPLQRDRRPAGGDQPPALARGQPQLDLDALDPGAERAQALVDPLVAAVDLADVADLGRALGAERARSASPCRRGCRGSPAARRRAARGP